MEDDEFGAGGPSQPGERPAPCEEEIFRQLDRIVSSPDFPSGGRCEAFLKYVIGEVAAGRGKRIKGYSIAIEVFDRKVGFTQDDPVVRIEAGRLRRALERYYLTAGQRDPIRIDIPKGHYVPTFTWIEPLAAGSNGGDEAKVPAPAPLSMPVEKLHVAWWRQWQMSVIVAVLCIGALIGHWLASQPTTQASSPEASAAPNSPTLVVAPFADLGEGADAKIYALGLTEELLTALPRFKEIRVFGRETTAALAQSDVEYLSSRLGARYLLTGGVRVSGSQLRVTARLLDTAKGTILWSQTYDDDLRTKSLFAIQSDVAGKVATAVAQPYGIITQTDAANFPPDDLTAYACTLRFYSYSAELSVEQHASVRDCLESAVARYPAYATAWAMLSIVDLDEHRFKFNQRSGEPTALERSLQAARRAVQLDPDNTRGLQALMTALFFNKQPEESLRVGERALAINPNDTELMGEYGTRLAMSGQWKRGGELLEVALSRNPGGAGYYHGILALAHYMQHDDDRAADEIGRANLQKFPLFHIVAAVIYAEQGMTRDADRESATFAKMGAQFLVDTTAEVEERLGEPEDRARLLAGIRKAGIVAPSALASNSSPERAGGE